jgi:hypothetical protein
LRALQTLKGVSTMASAMLLLVWVSQILRKQKKWIKRFLILKLEPGRVKSFYG